MSGIVLDCSSTLLGETVSLNQTQNSLIKVNLASRSALGFPNLLSAF